MSVKICEDFCEDFIPPPLPPTSAESLYKEVFCYVMFNDTLKAILQEYIGICQSHYQIPSTNCSTERGETANAGLIIGLVILSFAAVIFASIVVYWKCYKSKRQRKSPALPIDDYKNVNYLHNKAEKKKHWSSSSDQELTMREKLDHKTNGVTESADKGEVEKGVKRGSNLSTLNVNEKPVHAYQNEVFDGNEQEGKTSPGVTSNMSDTPLIDKDSVDGCYTLPNEAVQTKAGEGSEDKSRSSYGSTQLRVNALQPIEKQPNVSSRKKTKRHSKTKERKSTPCNNTELADDLAENRKSV